MLLVCSSLIISLSHQNGNSVYIFFFQREMKKFNFTRSYGNRIYTVKNCRSKFICLLFFFNLFIYIFLSIKVNWESKWECSHKPWLLDGMLCTNRKKLCDGKWILNCIRMKWYWNCDAIERRRKMTTAKNFLTLKNIIIVLLPRDWKLMAMLTKKETTSLFGHKRIWCIQRIMHTICIYWYGWFACPSFRYCHNASPLFLNFIVDVFSIFVLRFISFDRDASVILSPIQFQICVCVCVCLRVKQLQIKWRRKIGSTKQNIMPCLHQLYSSF